MQLKTVIETPKGSSVKYIFDEAKKQFVMGKILPSGMHFPFNFGFIPATRGEDGDPLDVIILSATSFATGREIEARLIGCLLARQTRDGNTFRNDRFVAVPVDSVTYNGYVDLSQIDTVEIDSIEQFFIDYLSAEGQLVHFFERLGALEAEKLLPTDLLS